MTTLTSRDFNRDVSAAKRAATDGLVVITDRGEPAFVLLTIDEYRRPMSLLLDTNVVSELRKRPGVIDRNVLAWSQRQFRADLYLSVITVMEIEFGIARWRGGIGSGVLSCRDGLIGMCSMSFARASCRSTLRSLGGLLACTSPTLDRDGTRTSRRPQLSMD